MRIEVEGHGIHLSTGGRPHVHGRPWILFLHGAGFTHECWVLQTRALAFDGWNVAAPDLPGHGLSAGKPLVSVAAIALWSLKLMDTLGCAKAVVAGHSLGSLVALEMAHRAPARIAGLILVGAAAEIPVNAALLDLAVAQEDEARQRMVSWSYGQQGRLHDNTWPGASHIHYALELMRRNGPGVLATDLAACAAYKDGAARAGALKAPALLLLAAEDRMTPLKAGRALGGMIAGSQCEVIEGAGHMIPTERPREANRAIRAFLAGIHSQAAVVAQP
jgi:pimeloyl-ACP methyl ester carboxylesterase